MSDAVISRIELEFSDREPMPGDVAAAISARQSAIAAETALANQVQNASVSRQKQQKGGALPASASSSDGINGSAHATALEESDGCDQEEAPLPEKVTYHSNNYQYILGMCLSG